MATVRDLGLLANAVYETSPSAPGWTCADGHAAAGAMDGFQAATFVKGDITVVAFRGTSQAMDGAADLALFTGMNSSYFAAGEAYAASLVGKENVVVCGHSLGGAIAQVVANRRGFRMVTFNAPGVATFATRNIGEALVQPAVGLRIAGNIAGAFIHPMQAARDVRAIFNVVQGLNICLDYDIVSHLGVHYGKVLRVPGPSKNPKTEHLMDTVNAVLAKPGLGDRNVMFL